VRREPNPCVYVPYVTAGRDRLAALALLVRTTAGANVAADIRRAVIALNPTQTITSVQVVRDAMAVGREEVRVSIYLTAPILVLALLLATTGIYGLLAQTVSQRTHELAVRVALGAGRQDLLRLVVSQGLKLAAAGAIVGSAAAFVLDRALGAFLYGVPAEQLLALLGAAALVIAVTVAASIVPCRRALTIDPGKTLKYE
jgi:putative ABC transport system permease protein